MRHALMTILSVIWTLSLLPHEAFGHGKNTHAKANLFQVVNHFGRTGNPNAVTRTIEVTMSDEMRFYPEQVTIAQGETIHFQIVNEGEILHEMVIGSESELVEHAELMLRFPNMEHAEPYMAHVPEQSDGSIYWTFEKIGTFHFGCLIPGHFQAGMRGRIVVTAAVDAEAATE